MTKPKIGIALGSGGARGWSHIGVLRGLEDLGIEPDCIAGCSMGALVGAAKAGGRLDELEEWSLNLTPAKAAMMVDMNFLHGGLVDAKPLIKFFEKLDMPELIEDQKIPYISVATDMRSGKEVLLKDGSIIEAMRASISLPGVVSPFFKDGRWLLDGGMSNPLPVSVCRDMGADVVIAVNPEGKPDNVMWEEPEPNEAWEAVKSAMNLPLRTALATLNVGRPKSGPKAPNYFDVVAMSIDLMIDRIRRNRLERDPPDVLIDVELDRFTILEFLRAEEAIAEGRASVAAMESEIEKALQANT